MPKLDITKIPARTGSSYPEPYNSQMQGRSQKALGDAGGLSQFGVNLVHLDPGAQSALRHWHEEQDEFLMVTAGELTLVDDTGETALAVGDCCAFPAGDANGHHVVNKGTAPGSFLVVGTRTPNEIGWYSDIDMKVTVTPKQFAFTRKDGTLLEDT